MPIRSWCFLFIGCGFPSFQCRGRAVDRIAVTGHDNLLARSDLGGLS
jgi:hypothetical protein